ncbi:MAG: hypothetical protein Q7R96_00650 [Nanoarchaeota archaeon]|nr:hypothetical protein [Nanoarchaeota archaeon]
MKPAVHFLSMVLFIIGILNHYPQLEWQALWFFIGGFCIDFDYYLFYVYTTKKYNIKGMLKHYNDHRNDNGQIRIFHTVEFVLLMLTGSVYYTFISYVFIGMTIHLLLDIFHLVVIKKHYKRRYYFITNWVRETFIIK